jgi:hypothetical protein
MIQQLRRTALLFTFSSIGRVVADASESLLAGGKPWGLFVPRINRLFSC